MPNKPTTTAPRVGLPLQSLPRIECLYVVRESDEWDLVLFDAMRQLTYVQHRSRPFIAALMGVGLAPLTSAPSFPLIVSTPQGKRTIDVQLEQVSRGTSKALLFIIGDSAHLWSRGTAAIVNEDGSNDFTEILCEAIARVSPRVVVAANFSRLIRNQDQGSALSKVISDSGVEEVVAGGIDFPFQGEKAFVGKMLFSMFAMVASMERDWIVTRLLAGKVASWRRKEWPFGAATVPFGYTYDKKQRRITPDESKRDVVRAMLLQLSADEVAPKAMVEHLERLGVVSMRPAGRGNMSGAMMTASNPRRLVDSFYSWAPIWISGEYLFRVRNSFTGLSEFAGVELARDGSDPKDRGELQMLAQVDLPDGGWAEPPVLAAFRAAALRRSAEVRDAQGRDLRPLTRATRSASQDPQLLAGVLSPLAMRGNDHAQQRRRRRRGQPQIAMLSGMSWTVGRMRYEMQVLRRGVYRVLAWQTGDGQDDRAQAERA